MKIFYFQGSIYFEDFGGKTYVLPDKSEGDVVLATMRAALNSHDSQSRYCKCHLPQVWGHDPGCPEYVSKEESK